MTDIIQDAKRLLEHATPGPWSFQPWSKYTGPNGDYEESALLDSDGETLCDGLPDSEGELIAAAPTNTRAIAGMEWEYQCQRLLAGTPDDWYTWLTTYSLESAKKQTKKYAAKQRARGYEPPSYRIRRRLVGDWEVINE